MPIVPQVVLDWLLSLSQVFHAASWESCLYLLVGLLYGNASASVVRAAEFAPRSYNWRRLHDFLRIGRWKGKELVSVLVDQILLTLYPTGLPKRLWWVVDITESEKAYARKIPGIKKHRRGSRGLCQSRISWSHRYLVLGLLAAAKPRWRALICSVALIWGRLTFEQQLKSFLLQSLPKMPAVVNTLAADRYFGSTRFLNATRDTDCEGVVRLKCNFKISGFPKQKGGVGRPPEYGQEYRVDELSQRRVLRRMKKSCHYRRIGDRMYRVTVWRGTFLRKGFGEIEILEIRWGRHGRMWLAATDPTLKTTEILDGSNGRWSVEPAIHEAKELGLGKYRGRSMAGVRRHPLLVATTHSLLSLIALGAIQVDLPELGWGWYLKETTVGQIQRRLLKWLQQVTEFHRTSQTNKSKKLTAAASIQAFSCLIFRKHEFTHKK
jgi:hypothetical protein